MNGKWVTKKTVTTNKNGKDDVTINDKAKGSWRANVTASSKTWSSTSKVRTVAKKSAGKAATKVTRAFDDKWSPSALTGKVSFNAGGGYKTAPKGTKVRIQELQNGKWVTKKTVKTNSSGKYKYSFGSSWETKKKRTGKYRAVVSATSKYKAKTSSTIYFKP